MQVTGGRGVERVFEEDFGGNLAMTLAVMRPDCRIGIVASRGDEKSELPFYSLLLSNVVIRFMQCYAIFGRERDVGMCDLPRWAQVGRSSGSLKWVAQVGRSRGLAAASRAGHTALGGCCRGARARRKRQRDRQGDAQPLASGVDVLPCVLVLQCLFCNCCCSASGRCGGRVR